MRPDPGAAGLAALSVCESILLSLTDNGIIDSAEATAILEDAATAHREAVALAGSTGPLHAETAALLQSIIDHGNSVRHADRQAAEIG
jgi:hypothetical protein